MRLMLLPLVLSIAMSGVACATQSADEQDSATAAATMPAPRQPHNGVLRDPVGDTIGIEGTVRGQTTVR